MRSSAQPQNPVAVLFFKISVRSQVRHGDSGAEPPLLPSITINLARRAIRSIVNLSTQNSHRMVASRCRAGLFTAPASMLVDVLFILPQVAVMSRCGFYLPLALVPIRGTISLPGLLTRSLRTYGCQATIIFHAMRGVYSIVSLLSILLPFHVLSRCGISPSAGSAANGRSSMSEGTFFGAGALWAAYPPCAMNLQYSLHAGNSCLLKSFSFGMGSTFKSICAA